MSQSTHIYTHKQTSAMHTYQCSTVMIKNKGPIQIKQQKVTQAAEKGRKPLLDSLFYFTVALWERSMWEDVV